MSFPQDNAAPEAMQYPGLGGELPLEVIERLYASMKRIRRVEEEVVRIYPSDKIKSPVHLSIGQEAVAAGVCEALSTEDVLFGTYRSHATYLAKGGNLRGMMAELYGKAPGCARGKGGSMHLIDLSKGVYGTSAVVATAISHAVGYGWGMKLKGNPVVSVSFFGDGAVEEGAFHESLNFAALHRLPVLFVCENNHYAVYTPFTKRQPLDNIYERPRAFGVETARVENNDVIETYKRTKEFVTRIREEREGPYFLEVITYRWRRHVGPDCDFGDGYRSEADCRPWMENDQITRLERMLPGERVKEIELEIEAEIADAVAFAEEAPFPDAAELHTDLFKE